jgi:hypothetical protein
MPLPPKRIKKKDLLTGAAAAKPSASAEWAAGLDKMDAGNATRDALAPMDRNHWSNPDKEFYSSSRVALDTSDTPDRLSGQSHDRASAEWAAGLDKMDAGNAARVQEKKDIDANNAATRWNRSATPSRSNTFGGVSNADVKRKHFGADIADEKKRGEDNISIRQGIARSLKEDSLTGDQYNSLREEAVGAGVTGGRFDRFVDQNNIKPDTPATGATTTAAPSKYKIASEIKQMINEGSMTPELSEKAKKMALDAGVTPTQFDSFVEKSKSDTLKQVASQSRDTEDTEDTEATAPMSAEEAMANVRFTAKHGTAKEAWEALQHDSYEGGAGLGKAEPIGPESSALLRQARREKKKGNPTVAARLAYEGARMRADEPAIDTEELRGQRMAQKREAGRAAREQDEITKKAKKEQEKFNKRAEELSHLDEQDAAHSADVASNRRLTAEEEAAADKRRRDASASIAKARENSKYKRLA